MNLTRAAIEKNRVTLTLLAVLLVAGVWSFFSLPRDEDPGFIIRTAQVLTLFPGAGPERVEQLVTDKLEKAIQEIPQIDFITSESKPGVSMILVNIQERYTDMRPIWDDLRRKVERTARELPAEIIGPTVNDEFGDVFGVVFTLRGEGLSYAELKDIAEDCRNELLLSREVAKVDIFGVQQERIFVEYSNARLAEFGISPWQLRELLEARNIIIPGGEIYTDTEQIILEPTGNFDSLEDLGHSLIPLPGRSELVYLKDLAEIRRGYVDPPQAKVRYRGEPALALAVNMRQGGNILALGEEVQAHLERFRAAYPLGVEFDLVAFQPRHVQQKVDDFVTNLLQAVLIVLLVVLVFLGLRTGLVVASLIPASMILALFVMGLLDIGIDQMSLASLIIALGLLVDNAIVMSESIKVSMEEGLAPLDAAVGSANELRVPLLTSSLTTAAAFLPIFLAESMTGEYTAPLFKVVTITLLCSWVLSLTLTPLLCVHFLPRAPKRARNYENPFYRAYRGFLLVILRRRIPALLVVTLVFGLALFGLRFVPQIFFPPDDKPIFFAELRLPVGTPLARTAQVVSSLEEHMAQHFMAEGDGRSEGILDWVAFLGAGAPRYILAYNPEPPSPEYAYLLVNASSREDLLTRIIPALEVFSQEHFPDLDAQIRPLFLGPPVENPVEVRISGRDSETLFALGAEVREQLAAIPGVRTITDDWGARTKKLVVRVNQPRAQRAGLSNRDVAVSLQSILTGLETTDFREDDQIIPVVLRSVAADRQDIGKLETYNIYVQATGESVPLMQVADVEMSWQPAKILRRDRLRTLTVQADVHPGANPIAIARQLDAALSEQSRAWPLGTKYEMGGELETSGLANDAINAKVPVAGLIILLLLVAQFNSFRRPLIILLTIPLGLVGVTLGLLVTGTAFGFMALLGLVSLAG
ncbi:efflux RND transporter permease subunit, partial [Geoalkalibacter halelectricus]